MQGATALVTGNGSAQGCGQWCCCLLRCRSEGMTGSAVGVPRASAERSQAIRRLSTSRAGRAHWLTLTTTTTTHGYRGCVLVGMDPSCSYGHMRLDGGRLVHTCWMPLTFNGFARACFLMPVDRPRCVLMLSLSSTHCTHRINTI